MCLASSLEPTASFSPDNLAPVSLPLTIPCLCLSPFLPSRIHHEFTTFTIDNSLTVHSRLITYFFSQILLSIDSLSPLRLTPRILDRHRFFLACLFFILSFSKNYFLFFSFALWPRLSWLLVSFWVHVKSSISYHIISYRVIWTNSWPI